MRTHTFSTALLGLLSVVVPAVAADQNLVIVSIGDSLAAGEGNPNSFNQATGHATWNSAPCHNSDNNGRRFASDRINDMSGFSTSFFDFSCSGAKIDAGILGSQLTTQPNVNNVNMPAQLDRVVTLQQTTLNNRPIDILMISIGVNDVNFANVVTACLLPGDCTHDPAVTTAISAIGSAALASAYQRLAVAIRMRLNVKHVYITGYPNEVKRDPSNFCGGLDIGDLSMVDVSQGESQFMFNNIIVPLNNAVETAAQAAQVIPMFSFPAPKSRPAWHFLGAPESTFTTHGYCTALSRRYMNTLQDSLLRQGDANGTMHPNINGHQAYADTLVSRATIDFDLPLEAPRRLRRVETNVGIPGPENVPFVKKAVTLEVAQASGSLTVTLQHRVITHGLFGDDFGTASNTTMSDTATGNLNLFAAQIPGSEGIVPAAQTLQYRFVTTATRDGQTASSTSSWFSMGAVLVQQ